MTTTKPVASATIQQAAAYVKALLRKHKLSRMRVTIEKSDVHTRGYLKICGRIISKDSAHMIFLDMLDDGVVTVNLEDLLRNSPSELVMDIDLERITDDTDISLDADLPFNRLATEMNKWQRSLEQQRASFKAWQRVMAFVQELRTVTNQYEPVEMEASELHPVKRYMGPRKGR